MYEYLCNLPPHFKIVSNILNNLQVEGAGKGSVDLGEMVYGSERSKVIRLVNKGLSSLPIRIFFINTVSDMFLWILGSKHPFYL